jgi:YegS/Rv2252/BmrU family lipid kinase
MNGNKPHIVINPFSAAGMTKKKLPVIFKLLNKLWGNQFSLTIVNKPFDAVCSTGEAIKKGAELIIGVGGDGTFQEIINGFFFGSEIINNDCCLGIIGSGTGQGFAQSLGIPLSIEEQFLIIKEQKTRLIDLGRITYFNNNSSYFINEFQLGIGAEVVKKVSQKIKKCGKKFAFGIGALGTLTNYKHNYTEIILNDKIEVSGQLLGIVIANGSFTGGGMRLTPEAKLDDGRFDVLIIPDMSLYKRLKTFSKIYSSDFSNTNGFQYYKAKKIDLKCSKKLRVEADGELIMDACTTIQLVPSILKVCTTADGVIHE